MVKPLVHWMDASLYITMRRT